MIFTQINRENNMNVVRYYLCLCILMNHFNVLTGEYLPTLPRIFGGVGSFFAISGFLMFSSFEKHPNLKGYFDRRARRILPPYILIVIVAALFLCFLSSLSFKEYFTSPQLYKYLVDNLLFINFAEPYLPGVFTDNIEPAVNGSLWTMKGEIACYIAVPFIYRYIKKHEGHARAIVCSLMVLCFGVYLALTFQADRAPSGLISIFAKQFRLFTFFFAGALLNLNLSLLKKYKWAFLLFAVSLVLLSKVHYSLNVMLRPFSDSILVIWFSMVGSWGKFLCRHEIVSYDVYLFHYPIIQSIISLGLVEKLGAWGALFLSIAISFILAMASWKLIGRAVLNKKIHLRNILRLAAK